MLFQCDVLVQRKRRLKLNPFLLERKAFSEKKKSSKIFLVTVFTEGKKVVGKTFFFKERFLVVLVYIWIWDFIQVLLHGGVCYPKHL